ncbi:MAG TPA: hypothetical protein VGG08_01130 [Solirubrobacteraceae bacterium]|jgi:hypothetical protein
MAIAVVALSVTAAVASAGVKEVMIVGHNPPPATYPKYVHYFTTIQAAVDAATRPRDFVLIEPGTYEEEVKVRPANAGIFIRGMDRNTVILDGTNIHPAGGANGIEVLQTNEIWIENLTVANFERETLDGPGGNEIFWNGKPASGAEKVGAHGWFGNYLTAYDTGLNGGYGIFTKDEKRGEWDNIYASGFNDSGMYLGGCPECEAVITHATMEYNALGYSGSNSGGQVIIENSKFNHNTTGVAPNTENPGDGPPPQNGACREAEPGHKRHKPLHGSNHQGPWEGKLQVFKTTNINHCTIIENNQVNDNGDLTLPANPSTAAAPWGVGVELPGDYGDLVLNNEIKRNPTDGVLAFEYPNPFEANLNFPPGTVFAQNAGNRVEGNEFGENGFIGGKEFVGDIAFQGGLFGQQRSTNNCVSDNVTPDPNYPAEINVVLGCQNETTPNPGGGVPFLFYLLELQEESENRPPAEPVGPPPAQETMPNPCEGVPANPLCR